jgi:hypothetical protein
VPKVSPTHNNVIYLSYVVVICKVTAGVMLKKINATVGLGRRRKKKVLTAVLQIRIRIRIHVFLGLLDPDPDPLVRGMDPDPDLDSSNIAKIVRKTLISPVLCLFLQNFA